MSIGTSIFLSCLLLSSILLYWLTRDRIHSWGIWIKRTLGGFSALLAVSLMWSAVYLTPYAWRGSVSTLNGLALGQSESDLLFERSDYYGTCTGSPRHPTEKLYLYWNDESKAERMAVFVIDGVIRRIGIDGKHFVETWDYRNIIRGGQTIDSLKRDWGEEDFYQSESADSRRYVYRRYNLAAYAANGRVEAVIVFDPDFYYKSQVGQKVERRCVDRNGVELNNQ